MVKLIILDLYGTLIKSDLHDRVVRPGLLTFLDYYKDSKKVVFSDGRPDSVRGDLESAGLLEKFNAIYDSKDCVDESVFYLSDLEEKKMLLDMGGGSFKNLAKVCEDFSISKKNSVFIGDNYAGREKKAARIHKIKYVHVPQFRERLPDEYTRLDNLKNIIYDDPSNPFSFKSLIGKLD